MRYPATFTPAEEGGFVVTFRDIPEAMTQGETEAEAIFMAEDVLVFALEDYFNGKRLIPAPSKPLENDRLIALPASVAAKALLLNEMLKQRVTSAELARRMNTRPQYVSRLTKLGHPTKIDTIAVALSALGRDLDLRATPRKLVAV
ncbi:MAG: type II toxin-antitoxin system HicB family antitoxin [Betaproteobacteria bacterium]|nr:type II toxin-antitoxin system HicB family antitoxin [Betaproteobacteria bacterium]